MLGTPWKGYYLTAYGIAVKHGFVGTEEEWLASLRGEPGAAAELRYNDEEKMIEWRPKGGEEWAAIVPLSELQGTLVAATLSEAQMAAESAGEAKTDAEDAAKTAKADAQLAAKAQKEIQQNIEAYGTVVKNAYILGDTLYISTNNGKTFAAGNVRGPKGNTGDSGVYIGSEKPEDETVRVWVDTAQMAELSDVTKILEILKLTDESVDVDLSDYMREDRDGITLYDARKVLVSELETPISTDGHPYFLQMVQETDGIHLFFADTNGVYGHGSIAEYIFLPSEKTLTEYRAYALSGVRAYAEANVPEGYTFKTIEVEKHLHAGVFEIKCQMVTSGGSYKSMYYILDMISNTCMCIPYQFADGTYCEEAWMGGGETIISTGGKLKKVTCTYTYNDAYGLYVGAAETVWENTIKEGDCAYYNGHWYVMGYGTLTKITDSGETLWTSEALYESYYAWRQVTFDGNAVYVVQSPSQLSCRVAKLDTESGAICWVKTITFATSSSSSDSHGGRPVYMQKTDGALFIYARRWDGDVYWGTAYGINTTSGELVCEEAITSHPYAGGATYKDRTYLATFEDTEKMSGAALVEFLHGTKYSFK